ncbi:MAG: Crp/Fnr family transcriptional regulator [Flavobacteriales bacterium]
MNPLETLTHLLSTHNLWEKEVLLERNEYLKVKGSIDTRIYFVKSGSLRVFVLEEFEEHTIRFGYQNNIIAALDSYISELPSDLYIQALKKTHLKAITKTKFMAFINSSETHLQLWLRIIEQLVFQQLERERDILTSSPLERYQRVLSRSPQLFQEIPNKYIASYLRMSPETLSRLKKS